MPRGKLRQPDALGNVVLGNFGSYHLCKCSTDVYTHLSTAGDHGCPTRAPDSPSRGSTQGQPSMGQGCPGSKPGNQHYQLNPFFFLRCVLSRHYPCICHWVAELLVSALLLLLPPWIFIPAQSKSWYAGAETLGDGFFTSSLWRIPKRLNQVLLLRAIICAESMCGAAFLPPGLSSCYQEYLRHGNTIGVIN